ISTLTQQNVLCLTTMWVSNAMFANRSSMQLSRGDVEGNSDLLSSKEKGNLANFQDQVKAQEHEISILRWQIAQAHNDEMQLLKERYALERKVSELQMDLKKDDPFLSMMVCLRD
ncbi:hypothetical protein Ancab_015648, partial [Ancistrocladus abbreviatus]